MSKAKGAWKAATMMAMARREAQRQEEVKRLMEEQAIEMKKIKKQLRQLRRKRDLYGRRVKDVLDKQEHWFKGLRHDKSEHETAIQTANAAIFKTVDAKNQDDVTRFIDEYDKAAEQVKKSKEDIHMLELKIKETDAGINAARIEIYELEKMYGKWRGARVDVCLKRMELATNSYCQQLVDNRNQTHLILHFQMQRDLVAKEYHHLLRDIKKIGSDIIANLDVAKEMYDTRDTAKRNMAKMQEMFEKSTLSYEQEMQDLEFKMEYYKELEKFMVEKNKPRPNEYEEAKRKRKPVPSVNERDSKMYQKALAKIRKDLGEDNLQAIVHTFLELVEENYMLFRNISETHEMIRTLQNGISSTKEKINEIQVANARQNRERMEQKAELDEKIYIYKKKVEEKEGYLRNAERIIETYTESVLILLSNLDYSPAEIERLAGIFHCVEERNIRDFLGEIEQYVNKLSDIQSYVEFLKWEHKRRSSLTPHFIKHLPPRLVLQRRIKIIPPSTDESDDERTVHVSGDVPLSRKEVKELVVEELERRANDAEYKIAPGPSMTDPTSEAIGDIPVSEEEFDGTEAPRNYDIF